jgi:hypothetical protein
MDAGATAVAAIEAFEDAGQPYPVINGEDQQDFLVKWQEEGLTAIAPTFPTFQWRTAVIAALKVLQGEEVPDPWRLPQPVVTQENLDQYVQPGMPPLHYAMCGCETMPGFPEPWGGGFGVINIRNSRNEAGGLVLGNSQTTMAKKELGIGNKVASTVGSEFLIPFLIRKGERGMIEIGFHTDAFNSAYWSFEQCLQWAQKNDVHYIECGTIDGVSWLHGLGYQPHVSLWEDPLALREKMESYGVRFSQLDAAYPLSLPNASYLGLTYIINSMRWAYLVGCTTSTPPTTCTSRPA